MDRRRRAGADQLVGVRAFCQAITRTALTLGAEHPNANELAEVDSCGSALSPKDAAARCVAAACEGDVDRARWVLDYLQGGAAAVAEAIPTRPGSVWWGWLVRPKNWNNQTRPHRRSGRAASGAPKKNDAAEWRAAVAAVRTLEARPAGGYDTAGLPLPEALGKAKAIEVVAESLQHARGLATFKAAREYVYHALKKF